MRVWGVNIREREREMRGEEREERKRKWMRVWGW